MAIIVPTITAENPHQYRDQIERVQNFATHLHVDVMDGRYTPNTGVEIDKVWLPEGIVCDIHVMYKKPYEIFDQLVRLRPQRVIIPADCKDDIFSFAEEINSANIDCGIALLPQTPAEDVMHYLQAIQHVLIFSGNLGHQGGSVADLNLLEKVKKLKDLNAVLTVGWDGGVTKENIKAIAAAGVDVINVGSAIHFADQPERAYQVLEQTIA